ncbi:MAG: hypothetical protein IKQ91_04985 [Oscillospiraceae bacterium]|nr:hypothetical protein [Oscillospiraceae bacterium]
MKSKITAVLMTAAAGCTLLTGCGSDQHMTNAEAPATAAATAVTEREHHTASTTAREHEHDRDDDNALYEEDDVHRRTDVSEPDLIDRAETALDEARDTVTGMVSDAKRKLDDMN